MANSTFSFATISGRLRHGVGVFLAGGLWSFASLSQAACPSATQPTSGSGTSNDPYLIETVENFYWMSKEGDGFGAGELRDSSKLAVYFKQTQDIDASSIEDCASGERWESPTLKGVYNGDNHVISNLTAYGDDLGLFGQLQVDSVAGVKNLTLKNFAVGKEDAGDVSGFVSSISYGTAATAPDARTVDFSKLKLISSTLKTTDSTGKIGGIVAFLSPPPPPNPGNDPITVTATLEKLAVVDTTMETTSTGTPTVGGLVGNVQGLQNFTLRNAYVDANLIANSSGNASRTGGLIGWLDGDATEPSVPSGFVEKNYAVLRDGVGSNTRPNSIELFGSASISDSDMDLTFQHLYLESADEDAGDTTGLKYTSTRVSAADLLAEATFSGFDFTASGPWRTNSLINDGAPYLSWEFSDPQVTVDTSSVPAGAGIVVSPSDDPITVALGQTQSVDITFNAGYVLQIDPASTCSGALTGSTYQTQALTEDCTIKINAFTHGIAFDGSVEGAAPNSGDGNSDGVADADQIHVASLPLTTDSGSVVYATLEAIGERPLVEVSPNPIDTGSFASLPNLSEGAEAVLGMLEFKALQVTSGATETFTVTVHSAAALEGVLKWNSDTSQWDSIGTVSGQSVTFDITDGGPYDRDGSANGEILDPIVPLTAAPASEVSSDESDNDSSDSGDSGNGGSDNGDSGGDESNDEPAQANEPPPAKPVPTTSSFVLMVLAALMLGLVLQHQRRHRQQRL